VRQIGRLRELLAKLTRFYEIAGDTYKEAHEKLAFLKDIIVIKEGTVSFT
jgi:hypothetical protein